MKLKEYCCKVVNVCRRYMRRLALALASMPAFCPTPFKAVDSLPRDSSSFGLQGDTDVICVLTEEFICWYRSCLLHSHGRPANTSHTITDLLRWTRELSPA